MIRISYPETTLKYFWSQSTVESPNLWQPESSLWRIDKMGCVFETCLTEKQAFFLRRNLNQTIGSMRSLLQGLHRENARWHSLETDALLKEDEAEIAALQFVVDELDKLAKAHGWEMADTQREPTAAPIIEIATSSAGSNVCPVSPNP
jgi:hypothetical protein